MERNQVLLNNLPYTIVLHAYLNVGSWNKAYFKKVENRKKRKKKKKERKKQREKTYLSCFLV